MTTHPDAADTTDCTPVYSRDDIAPPWRGTPIATLLEHHNLDAAYPRFPAPELIIVACMDNRVALRLPPDFAFVLRTAGAAVEPVRFNIACALAIRQITAIAVIGHSDCAMVDVTRHRAGFLDTMTKAGWMTRAQAESYFDAGATSFGCSNAVENTKTQCAQLRSAFPGVTVAPLFYDVGDGRLYQVEEGRSGTSRDVEGR